MQDLEKNIGKWQGESEQEAGNDYIIGSFVSLTFRLTFFFFWIITSRCVGSFVHQQRVFGSVAYWFLLLPTEGLSFLAYA
jgi:hypothetical protein